MTVFSDPIKGLKNSIIDSPELTAFVREIVLPGSTDTAPKLDSRCCRFDLTYQPSPIRRRTDIFYQPTANHPGRRINARLQHRSGRRGFTVFVRNGKMSGIHKPKCLTDLTLCPNE